MGITILAVDCAQSQFKLHQSMTIIEFHHLDVQTLAEASAIAAAFVMAEFPLLVI
jgi:hypothetical protein